MDPRIFRSAAQATALVARLTITVVLGTLAGGALDDWLQTSPALLVLGISAGFALGLWSMISGFNRLYDDDEPPPSRPS